MTVVATPVKEYLGECKWCGSPLYDEDSEVQDIFGNVECPAFGKWDGQHEIQPEVLYADET